MRLYRSAGKKQLIVQATHSGAKSFLKGARLSILNWAQIDPVFKRTKGKAAFGPSAPDQDPFLQSRRQSRPQRDRRGVAGLRYCRCGLLACALASLLVFIGVAQLAHFRTGKRAVLVENPQRDAVSGRPAAGIRFFSQPVPAKPFEPYRRHFHGQP